MLYSPEKVIFQKKSAVNSRNTKTDRYRRKRTIGILESSPSGRKQKEESSEASGSVEFADSCGLKWWLSRTGSGGKAKKLSQNYSLVGAALPPLSAASLWLAVWSLDIFSEK